MLQFEPGPWAGAGGCACCTLARRSPPDQRCSVQARWQARPRRAPRAPPRRPPGPPGAARRRWAGSPLAASAARLPAWPAAPAGALPARRGPAPPAWLRGRPPAMAMGLWPALGPAASARQAAAGRPAAAAAATAAAAEICRWARTSSLMWPRAFRARLPHKTACGGALAAALAQGSLAALAARPWRSRPAGIAASRRGQPRQRARCPWRRRPQAPARGSGRHRRTRPARGRRPLRRAPAWCRPCLAGCCAPTSRAASAASRPPRTTPSSTSAWTCRRRRRARRRCCARPRRRSYRSALLPLHWPAPFDSMRACARCKCRRMARSGHPRARHGAPSVA